MNGIYFMSYLMFNIHSCRVLFYFSFSYYGIRTVLYIFLTEFCELDKDTSTAVYHAFSVWNSFLNSFSSRKKSFYSTSKVICYFSPILGAILADGYIGLYWTILSVSCFYLVGEVVLTLFSLVPLSFHPIVAVSLIIINLLIIF